jgi:hypothetical protein
MIGAAMTSRDVAKPVEGVAKPVEPANLSAKPAKIVANRDYYLQRLRDEFPPLAERVAKEQLSVYRACVEAGIRKPAGKAQKWTKIDAYMPEGVEA